MTNNKQQLSIQQTTNYAQFSFLGENREINRGLVRSLALSIQEENHLAINPIFINEKYEVIDGQHRLEAAKNLKLPIYYVILNNASFRTIVLLNTNVRMWKLEDYLHAYIAMGNAQYIQLQAFCKEYSIGPSLAIGALRNTFTNLSGMGVKNQFKQGTFVIADLSRAEHFVSFYNALKPYCRNNCQESRDFKRAVGTIFEKIDQKLLLSILAKNTLKLNRQISRVAYLRQFEDVLNFKKSANITRLI